MISISVGKSPVLVILDTRAVYTREIGHAVCIDVNLKGD